MSTTNKDTLDIATELITLYEGFKSKAYLDPVGIPTVGFGFTRMHGRPVTLKDNVSLELAKVMLAEEIEEFVAQTRLAMGVKLWENLDPFQQAGVLAFVFNCGVGTMKKCRFFKNMKAEGGVTPTTHTELATSVVTAGGTVLKGLQRRRLAESLVFQGVEPSDAFKEATIEFP